MPHGMKMKIDITEKIHKFREAARNLWNVHLRESAGWDSHEAFKNICLVLFREIVLRDLPNSISAIELNQHVHDLSNYSVSSKGGSRLPILANRQIPASGYWDYSIEWIPTESEFQIQPICFFDFDSLGWCDLEYLRVLFTKCVSHPALEGREALIKCSYVKIEVIKSA